MLWIYEKKRLKKVHFSVSKVCRCEKRPYLYIINNDRNKKIMTSKEITSAVKKYIKETFGHTCYTGQVRMNKNGVLTIDNRQDFAPWNTTAQIVTDATKINFTPIGTSSAYKN